MVPKNDSRSNHLYNVPSRAYFTKCGLLFSENKDDTHGVLKTNKYCLRYTVP